MNHEKKKFIELVSTLIIMAAGLLLLKYLPMNIFGNAILFDASAHIVIACFVLYIIYLFIDRNKSWKIPYLVLSLVILSIISIQRILVSAHDDIGLLIGFLLSVFAIIAPQWKKFGGKIKW